uniref:Uncharacterized protein n=1 Tax=Plectus sambesii TaxID=2011161 RepID=A0A914XJZ4_9BILA
MPPRTADPPSLRVQPPPTNDWCIARHSKDPSPRHQMGQVSAAHGSTVLLSTTTRTPRTHNVILPAAASGQPTRHCPTVRSHDHHHTTTTTSSYPRIMTHFIQVHRKAPSTSESVVPRSRSKLTHFLFPHNCPLFTR